MIVPETLNVDGPVGVGAAVELTVHPAAQRSATTENTSAFMRRILSDSCVTRRRIRRLVLLTQDSERFDGVRKR